MAAGTSFELDWLPLTLLPVFTLSSADQFERIGYTKVDPAPVMSIVCTPKSVWLCRPSEAVLDLLDRMPPGPFYKKAGELPIDRDWRRVG